MRILVTGGAGYLGSVLVPALLSSGHDVTVLDRFFFGEESLGPARSDGRLSLVRDDIRWCDGKLFEEHDAVVDLAALSNDPAGALDPWKTYEINYLGRVRVARLAREAAVRRYIVTSSCSIYGFQPGILTEESDLNPLTAYARANVLIERDNLPLSSDSFVVTALRFATLYGLSPRMRFDLAINGMALGGFQNHRIPVMRDGEQWRPFLHVKDASRAIESVLTADPNRVRGEVFNAGDDRQNFQIKPLAEIVAGGLSSHPSVEWYGDPDRRSYQVDFGKIRRTLGFESRLGPLDAVHEVEQGLGTGNLTPSLKTKTVEWYRHLLTDSAARQKVELRGSVL